MPLCTGKISYTRGRETRTRPRGSGWVATDVAARAVRVSPQTVRRYAERGGLRLKCRVSM